MATGSCTAWLSTTQSNSSILLKPKKTISMRQSLIMSNNSNPTSTDNDQGSPKRKPGRPPTYIFTKPDSELSENELRLKSSVLKRRQRQNRSYHRKKILKQEQEQQKLMEQQASVALDSLAFTSALGSSSSNPALHQPFQNSMNASPAFTSILSDLCTPSPAMSPDQSTQLFSDQSFPISSILQPSTSQPSNSLMNISPSPLLPAIPSSTSIMSANNLPNTTSLFLDSIHPHVHPSSCGPRPTENKPSTCANDDILKQVTEMSSLGSNFSDLDEEKLLNGILEPARELIKSEEEKATYSPNQTVLSRDAMIDLASLPVSIVELLYTCSLFMDSFTSHAIVSVAGLPNQSDEQFLSTTFSQLEKNNFARQLSSGRLQLTSVGRAIAPNAAVDAEPVRKRFVEFYSNKLKDFHPTNVNTNGAERIRAVEYCDSENANIKCAVDICMSWRDKAPLINLLYNGATVLRYSISAHDRIKWFTEAISRIEESSSDHISNREVVTRMYVALAEAHMDILSFEEAQKHLDESIRRMSVEKQDGAISSISTAISPLLLAELHIKNGSYDVAQRLLKQLLRHLQTSGMQYTTFAICCLLNLATVFRVTHVFDSALRVMHAAMDVLIRLGFNHMPIYADALQTLGTIHMEQGNTQEAQRLFSNALNVLEQWKSRRKWNMSPIQHCAHLDIFLIECIAKTMFTLNRTNEGKEFLASARQRRLARNLKAGLPFVDNNSSLIVNSNQTPLPILTRHLY